MCVYRCCADEIFADWIMNEIGSVLSRGRDTLEPIRDIMSMIKDLLIEWLRFAVP